MSLKVDENTQISLSPRNAPMISVWYQAKFSQVFYFYILYRFFITVLVKSSLATDLVQHAWHQHAHSVLPSYTKTNGAILGGGGDLSVVFSFKHMGSFHFQVFFLNPHCLKKRFHYRKYFPDPLWACKVRLIDIPAFVCIAHKIIIPTEIWENYYLLLTIISHRVV